MFISESPVGTLYITMYYICFRPSTRSRAQEKKLHLNDIYDLRQDEQLLIVATDRERFEIQFNEKPVCAYVRDLIRVLSETKSGKSNSPCVSMCNFLRSCL